MVYDEWICSCGAGINKEKQQLIISSKGTFIVPKETKVMTKKTEFKTADKV